MTRSMTWIAADGTETNISDGSAGITLLADPVGLEAANPSNTIDEYSAFDGGVIVHRRKPVRQIALPLYLEHATRVETLIAQVASMLQGPGQLRWTDGLQTRTLKQVIYEGGFDGSGIFTLRERVAVASMLALDPWWYGPAASQVIPFASPTGFNAALAFSSLFPFDGGGSTAVAVDGDGDAWPVFTITGPETTLVVSSGGISWQLSAALAAGHTLVVDHRPGSRGPSLDGAPIDWSLLTEASRLFPLAASGSTAVITGATGTTANSQVLMAFEPRYLTP